MIEQTEYADVWPQVKHAARTTIGKAGAGLYPDEKWKKTALLAEHSMIRKIRFQWVWVGLKSWVSTHFVRHKVGIEHWVSTQRSDRTGVDRSTLAQDAPVRHEADANAQALIHISRKRLCMQAAPETRAAWEEVKEQVAQKDPVLAEVMVRECVYRGFCPEFHSCGYADTPEYRQEVERYRTR